MVGDPLDERVDVGPMIDAREVDRIESWVQEALAGGAQALTGGRRADTVYYPTLLTDVRPEMKVVAEEAFAPTTCRTAATARVGWAAKACASRWKT